MSNLHVNEAEATAALNEFIDNVVVRQQELSKHQPQFPSTAAGRDFAEHARRIQAKLAQIYTLRNWRLENMRNMGHAAMAEVGTVSNAEDANTARLGAVPMGDA